MSTLIFIANFMAVSVDLIHLLATYLHSVPRILNRRTISISAESKEIITIFKQFPINLV